MRVYAVAITSLTLCLLSGCRTTPPDLNDTTEALLPEKFSLSTELSPQNSLWWWEFERPELDQLVARAMSNNLSVSKAAAKLEQAEALSTQRGAAQRPTLSTDLAASVTERENPVVTDGDTRTESASLALAASYEIDLWGRLSSIADAADMDRRASQHDLETVKISTAAEVTMRYFELVNIRSKIDLINDQLETAGNIAELIQLRYRKSQSSALDVLQQKEIIAQIESLLPPLRARETLTENQLAALLGAMPGINLGISSRTMPPLPKKPGSGLPSELLKRRPDIAASLARLESSHATVSSAKADRLPSLSITARGGYSSSEISDLFDNWITNLAGSILAPLLDGGRRKAEVIRTEAIVKERLADYKETVIRAVHEVENAITQEQRQLEYLAAVNRRLNAAENTQSEARARYRKGVESYLSALRAQTEVQTLQRQILDGNHDLIVYRVNLYRSLAGSWNDNADNSKSTE